MLRLSTRVPEHSYRVGSEGSYPGTRTNRKRSSATDLSTVGRIRVALYFQRDSVPGVVDRQLHSPAASEVGIDPWGFRLVVAVSEGALDLSGWSPFDDSQFHSCASHSTRLPVILHAARSETSSNFWKLSVISEAKASA